MPDLFEPEIGVVQVTCGACGTPLELASSALSVFGSRDAVLCMDCLLRQGTETSTPVTVPLSERIQLIDKTVEEFSAHLRNVLLRCIKPDLTWNREYGLDAWSDPLDMMAAAYAPGLWYGLWRSRQERGGYHDDI